MAHIDYYFSTISPYSYFCGLRPAEIAARHGASLTYKPLDMMALYARTGGVRLAERHPNRQAYRLQELARTSKKTGLPYTETPLYAAANSAPASYAIIAAQDVARDGNGGDLGALVFSILRACWAEEKNIAEDEVINACLADAGFDPALSFTGMLKGAETYARNLEEAVDAGVFGAPFFVVNDGQMFWGADRLDDLDAHLAGAAG